MERGWLLHFMSQEYEFILRIDDSFTNNNSLVSIGWTLSDRRGNLLAVAASPIRTWSITLIELFAILAGLEVVAHKDLSDFILFTDSMLSYQLISGCVGPNKDLKDTVNNCKLIIENNSGRIFWSSRHCQSTLDKLAKITRMTAVSNYWEDYFEDWISDLNCNDFTIITIMNNIKSWVLLPQKKNTHTYKVTKNEDPY